MLYRRDTTLMSTNFQPCDLEMRYQFDHDFIEHLTVKRRANSHAFMVAEEFVGVILPHESYAVTTQGVFRLKQKKCEVLKHSVEPVKPEVHVIPDTWKKYADVDDTDKVGESEANILGGSTNMWVIEACMQVPEAPLTPETLAYFGAHLLDLRDGKKALLQFNTEEKIPIITMEVGDKYIENYLLEETQGGGCYIEYHSAPHLHLAMAEEVSGFLMLGKQVPGVDGKEGTVELAAFPIPFGYAIYTPPWTIHCDAFLIGKYTVGYTAAEHFETGVLMNPAALKPVVVTVKALDGESQRGGVKWGPAPTYESIFAK